MPHENFLRAYLSGRFDNLAMTEQLTRDDQLGDLDAEEMTMLADFNIRRAEHLGEYDDSTKTVIKYCRERARCFKAMAGEESELQTAFERGENDQCPDPRDSLQREQLED